MPLKMYLHLSLGVGLEKEVVGEDSAPKMIEDGAPRRRSLGLPTPTVRAPLVKVCRLLQNK